MKGIDRLDHPAAWWETPPIKDLDNPIPKRGLLPLPHVQFRKTENSWRLDRSHRGGHRRDIPCLVDAADVRTMNAEYR
jgi:hypothetical protein